MRWAWGLAIVICACSSNRDEPSDAGTTITDIGGSDTAIGFDTAVAPDTSACPEFFPGEGQACSAAMPCTFKDQACGGTQSASCVDGKWKLATKSECEPYCPPSKPDEGTACTGYPADRTCTFWPTSMDACESCTCKDGKWACTVPTTCPLTYSACKPMTACTANTGCGAGKCNYFCACGVDGVLHCSANPC